MQSAAQILVRHGYKGTTTARVAGRAGTSIGSIYQYFLNKEALIQVWSMNTQRTCLPSSRAYCLRPIEQEIGKLKRFNPVELRCEKTKRDFAAIVSIVASFILVNPSTLPSVLPESKTIGGHPIIQLRRPRLLKNALAMAADLARRNRASRSTALRPFHADEPIQ